MDLEKLKQRVFALKPSNPEKYSNWITYQILFTVRPDLFIIKNFPHSTHEDPVLHFTIQILDPRGIWNNTLHVYGVFVLIPMETEPRFKITRVELLNKRQCTKTILVEF